MFKFLGKLFGKKTPKATVTKNTKTAKVNTTAPAADVKPAVVDVAAKPVKK